MEFYKIFHNRSDFYNLWRWARIINNAENIDDYIEHINKCVIIDARFGTNIVRDIGAYFNIGKEKDNVVIS